MHGEANEMAQLESKLKEQYGGDGVQVHSPKVTEAVSIQFQSEKLAKVHLPALDLIVKGDGSCRARRLQ